MFRQAVWCSGKSSTLGGTRVCILDVRLGAGWLTSLNLTVSHMLKGDSED